MRSLSAHPGLLACALVGVVATTAPTARADDAGPSEDIHGCVESGFEDGATKPKLDDSFPTRGTSGYASTLRVTLTHGKGETVLPLGFDRETKAEAAKVLKAADFILPEQDAGFGALLTVTDVAGSVTQRTSVLELPLVPLPEKPGRHRLLLPGFPIQVARANGKVVTLCTRPHTIDVEDPIANVPDARPRENPAPRPQREEWTSLRRALEWIGVGALVGSALAYIVYRIVTRPRPVAPPPPPRPPWEVALERLDEIRHAGLLETGRIAEFFDRVNDAVRSYLGARYGFDGLESTTDEVMTVLRRVPYFGIAIPEVSGFLQTCDLVKFAKMLPTYDECRRAIDEGERIVRATMPPPASSPSRTDVSSPGGAS